MGGGKGLTTFYNKSAIYSKEDNRPVSINPFTCLRSEPDQLTLSNIIYIISIRDVLNDPSH